VFSFLNLSLIFQILGCKIFFIISLKNNNIFFSFANIYSSATVIKNVSLGENATIIGGKLAGTISGTPKNPAILQWRFYDYLS
jgi:hypothetical protein